MSKITIIEGNNNDKDNVRAYMVKGEKGDKGETGDPTKLSQLENDTGFITKEEANLTNYYTKAEVDTTVGNLNNALNQKANTSDVSNTYATKTSVNTSITNEATSRTNGDDNLQSQINAEASTRSNSDNNLQSQINGLASGSPLVASSTAGMTDTSRVYVNTSDGKWYYYNGSSWVAGGTYTSSFSYSDLDTIELATNFKEYLTSSDWQKGSLNISNGSVITSSQDRIATTNIHDITKDTIFYVREGYKMCFHVWQKSNGTYTNAYHIGWVNNGDYVIIPAGSGIRASLSDINNTTNISTNDCDKLLYKELDTVYVPNYYEENLINSVNFFVMTQQSGIYKLVDAAKSRGFQVEYVKFPYDLKIKVKNNSYGLAIYKYDDDFNYLGQIDNWDGTYTELTIPKNTYFRTYFRLLNNGDLSDNRSDKLKNVGDIFEIKVDIVSDISNEIMDNLTNISDLNTEIYGYDTERRYFIKNLINFRTFSINNLQGVLYDFARSRILQIDGSTTVHSFNYKGELIETFTKPNTSHDNDICYVNENAYIVGSYYSLSHLRELFLWDIENNTATSVDISSIQDNTNGSKRVLGGVCETNLNSGYLYLVCADWYSSGTNHSAHQVGDKLSIYKYKISDGSIELLNEYNWDCVYIQGATCLNDILYVACNTQTDNPSNYLGITIKRFDMKTNTELSPIIIDGFFEAESINYIIENGIPKLVFGVGHAGTKLDLVELVL